MPPIPKGPGFYTVGKSGEWVQRWRDAAESRDTDIVMGSALSSNETKEITLFVPTGTGQLGALGIRAAEKEGMQNPYYEIGNIIKPDEHGSFGPW